MFHPSFNICGLVYGPQEHHLDHMATLCACLDIPLVVTDEAVEALAKKYYPQLVVFYFSYLTAAKLIIDTYQAIITTMPFDLFDSVFFLAKKLTHKNPITLWCPHGNSDKGIEGFFSEALRKEKAVFIYGNKMLKFFQDKEALSINCAILTIGNYRLSFYLKHKNFYQKLVNEIIRSKLVANNKTYLYAPTWNDHEGLSSFHSALPSLLENLPKEINLIIKLHPNTLFSEDLNIKKMVWKYESSPNVLFLENFPLIYPLLDFVDIYIGDTSSIGYDFLSFQKPLFFLNIDKDQKSKPLYLCGTVIEKKDFQDIYPLIESSLSQDFLLSQKRKEIYQETFSATPDFAELLKQIEIVYQRQKTLL